MHLSSLSCWFLDLDKLEALKALSFKAPFLSPLDLVLAFQSQSFSAMSSCRSSILFGYLSLFRVFRVLLADDGSKNLMKSHDIYYLTPPPPSLPAQSNIAPFRPSIAVIVGVLTTMFLTTFLLLFYAKHCRRNSEGNYGGNPNAGFTSSNARRNSGIDRTIIESLPIFKFSSLRGPKDGLECAVCLNRFELAEVLRLLPKCKHAFHVECVDTWLDAHSTCPLCRFRVDPEDILLVEDLKPLAKLDDPGENATENGRVSTHSGRHSSAGEKTSSFMMLHRDEQNHDNDNGTCRNSVDGSFRNHRKKEPSGSRLVETASTCCLECGRKDGFLLEAAMVSERESFERRLSHRIIVSDVSFPRRWSDLKPSDLLFLRSEMIITNSGRYSFSRTAEAQEVRVQVPDNINGDCSNNNAVINSRSVSEITGLSRFKNNRSTVRAEEEKIKNWLNVLRTRHSEN